MESRNKRITALLSSTIIIIIMTGLILMGSGFSFALAPTTPPINLKTDNGSVVVTVEWSPKEIQQAKDVQFSITLQDPSSNTTLQHVNYNLQVKDANGTTVKSLTNLHSHTGKDVQTITFDKAGDFQLTVTVLGLGLTKPFDTSKSGTAMTPITIGS